LARLREALEITQVELAARLGWSQAVVSRLERHADMYVSSLESYVEALGGCLELRARLAKGAPRSLRLGVQEDRRKR
jgi:predicted transcriptional regulator